MNEHIRRLQKAVPSTPVKVYVKLNRPVDFPGCITFHGDDFIILCGQWADIAPVLEAHRDEVTECMVEADRRNSRLPLMPLEQLNARVEPGAVIRQGAQIADDAVIMMGAVVNVGAMIGSGTMVDMGAVIGGGARVGKNCHIGANAVLAGMIEPACMQPVVVEDGVLIGAGAVILEGVCVGRNAVVGAGAVVTADVPPDAVVVGNPARFLKWKDQKAADKVNLTDGLR